jgi:uncharacterized protein YcaQ
VATLRLTRQQARRVAVSAQRLDADRPTDLVALIDHLMFLQLDPTAAVAPAADLIAWTRLGGGYRPSQLRQALDERKLFEFSWQDEPKSPSVATVRPMADLPLFLARMAGPAKYERVREWLKVNEPFRLDVLARLAEAGPLQSKQIADSSVRSWQSTGWTGNRNVTQMLEILLARGQVAIAGRAGKQRLWDLAERVYPAGLTAVPEEEATAQLDRRRLCALGIARAVTTAGAGVPAEVEGSGLEWRVDPEALDRPFTGRVALLSPFDRLIHDRIRCQELFDYEYILEMYKPAAARRWGYFAMPVLHHDQLIGKLDVSADRKKGELRVTALHPDVRITRPMEMAVGDEVRALADWLDLDVVGL